MMFGFKFFFLSICMLLILAGCTTSASDYAAIPVEYKTGSPAPSASSAPDSIDSAPAEVLPLPQANSGASEITVAELTPLASVKSPYAPARPTLTVASVPSSMAAPATPPPQVDVQVSMSRLLEKVPPSPTPSSMAPVSFAWPVSGTVMREFGGTTDGFANDGITIGAPMGVPVKTASSGVVAAVDQGMKGLGTVIIVQHPGAWLTIYAHLDSALVDKGETVTQGQVIGTVGRTGNVAAPQLYFQMRQSDTPVDPQGYLR